MLMTAEHYGMKTKFNNSLKCKLNWEKGGGGGAHTGFFDSQIYGTKINWNNNQTIS